MTEKCKHGYLVCEVCAEERGYAKAEQHIIAELGRYDSMPEWKSAAAWIKGGKHRPKAQEATNG